jgi:hypothetical protein
VQIAGAGSVVLDEVDPRIYEGAYTIRQRDRITPATTATVNLRVGNPGRQQRARRIAHRRGGRAASVVSSAQGGTAGSSLIERFDVAPANRLEPGADLVLHGQRNSGRHRQRSDRRTERQARARRDQARRL